MNCLSQSISISQYSYVHWKKLQQIFVQ